jgi:MOSC domain-containing protein YiiM
VARLVSVQIGRVAPLGPRGVPSAFRKRPVEGAVAVHWLGLAGDEQADKRVHGGTLKAVYAYPEAHYAAWLAEFPEHEDTLVAGAFGENLTIGGLTEAEVRAGDVHAIGTARLRVTQPREPCFKLALAFGDNRLPRALARSGRSGWYYEVLEPGVVSAGDAVHVEGEAG